MTAAQDSLRNPLCVALDYVDPDECARMAGTLGPSAGTLKVGLQSFASGGPELVRVISKEAPVFLDLKLHDIPAQVSNAIRVVAEMDVRFTTVHALGGREMLRAAAESSQGSISVLAVTMLTSLDDNDLGELGVTGPVSDRVLALTELALSSEIEGLVCSPHEVAAIRDRFGATDEGGPLLVVPGIRPTGGERDDQRRVMNPRQAIEAGADIIVVGRPITQSADPVSAATTILDEIA